MTEIDGRLPARAESSATPVVTFLNVSKTYDGESYAVKDLTLGVKRGEFLTFLGPSGSGKTTSLLLLAGFEAITSGDILIDSRSVASTPSHKRNIGMVFQNYALFPHMNVLQNVSFPLSVRGAGKAESYREAERVLEMVRLGGLQRRRPNQLSGGQQQRTALARALVFNPPLVLMDEPFGALDKKLREQMQQEVKQIHRQLGNTMISVTHDQSEALTMSDRIAVFRNGELQQVAAPDEIYDYPANAFVASFIGETNTISITIEMQTEAQLLARTISGEAIVVSKLKREMAPGCKAILMLRPERISMNLAGPAKENSFKAIVEDKIYLGDHIRCRLNIFGRKDWIAKITDTELGASIRSGIVVNVGWDASDCMLFPDGEAQAQFDPFAHGGSGVGTRQ